MTAPAPAGPFTPGDPLAYHEPTDAQVAWRALLHQLATGTVGATVEVPDRPGLAADLYVAAGWRYLPYVKRTPRGTLTVAAALSGFPEQPDADTDAAAWWQRYAAELQAAGATAAEQRRGHLHAVAAVLGAIRDTAERYATRLDAVAERNGAGGWSPGWGSRDLPVGDLLTLGRAHEARHATEPPHTT